MNSLDSKPATRGSCNAPIMIQPEQGTARQNQTPQHQKPHQFRPNPARISRLPTGSARTAPKSNRIAIPRARHPYSLHARTRPDKTARRPGWRGWGRPNRVPRRSSCESRGARPSRGRRGSWRAPRTATAAVAAAATVRRRRQRGQGRPSRHSPRRRGSGEPNPRLPPPRARLSCFSGVYLVEKGSGSGGN